MQPAPRPFEEASDGGLWYLGSSGGGVLGAVSAVLFGCLGGLAADHDRKMWFRCGTCGVYVRGAARGVSEFLAGLMYGDRGRAGAVWRPPAPAADQRAN